jgi:isochorismate synthase EntC
MQKNLKISFKVNHEDFSLNLKKTLLKDVDLDRFYSLHPFFYFRPKDSSIEYFASGLSLLFHHHVLVEGPKEVLFFTVGDNHHPQWNDLGKVWCFLPEKLVIKSRNRVVLYEWESIHKLPKINSESLKLKIADKSCARESIEKIISSIKQNHFDKCIYARLIKIPNPSVSIKKLRDSSLTGTKFFVQFDQNHSFLGSTPEWIFKRFLQRIEIDSIAGTSLIENADILESQKIIDEFDFVKRDIQESMSDFILEGSFNHNDAIIKHHNLLHRFNRFSGKLRQNISDLDILNSLHPTSAISGFPKKMALEFIRSNESFDRGFYASPVGLLSKQKSYLAVAIRSMLQQHDSAFIFAGAGITKDSNFEDEWHELESKLKIMQDLANTY